MEYAYASSHPHAVTHVDGVQRYWYDANGNQTQRDTTFGTRYLLYDAENRLRQVLNSLPAAPQSSMRTTFDGNRVLVTQDGETTAYVSNMVEYSTGVLTTYYYADGQRIAMRQGSTLSYLLSDHLGSTSVTVDSSERHRGGRDALHLWGETRYESGTTPTDWRFCAASFRAPGKPSTRAPASTTTVRASTIPRLAVSCRPIPSSRSRATRRA